MIRVRACCADDAEALPALLARNGLSAVEPEAWRAGVVRHPWRQYFEGVPHGWVLEREGSLVGTISNVHQLYDFEGTTLRAGVAASWAVDEDCRNSSLLLALAYLKQKGVDVCLNASASRTASPLMEALRMKRVPAPGYGYSYLWVADYPAFCEAVLRKKKLPASAKWAAAAALKGADLLRRPAVRLSARTVRRLDGFSDEFDALWEVLQRGRSRLRALRTSEALQWRFGAALRAGRLRILGVRGARGLTGYCLLQRKTREHLGLKQFVVADLQAAGDDAATIQSLLVAARAAAKEEGLHLLEMRGWDAGKRLAAEALRPRRYEYPVWQAYYSARLPQAETVLADERHWDLSPFDAA